LAIDRQAGELTMLPTDTVFGFFGFGLNFDDRMASPD
jgi:hypothetical protein